MVNISISGLGIDELLSKHIAHLFIRDPLVVFEDALHLDDDVSSDHFEVRTHTALRLVLLWTANTDRISPFCNSFH
jgi:hypothetical protein